MAVTYTTATIVRKVVENIDASLVDADIDVFIYEAESIIDATIGRSFISSFDSSKHYILRAAANKWAALSCVVFNPNAFTTLNEAQTIIETLNTQWEICIEQLQNKTTIAYIESL